MEHIGGNISQSASCCTFCFKQTLGSFWFNLVLLVRNEISLFHYKYLYWFFAVACLSNPEREYVKLHKCQAALPPAINVKPAQMAGNS